MADELDRASDYERAAVESATKHIRNSARQRQLIPVGSCYYCNTSLSSGMLFCDAECRDDWEAEKASQQRNGHGPI